MRRLICAPVAGACHGQPLAGSDMIHTARCTAYGCPINRLGHHTRLARYPPPAFSSCSLTLPHGGGSRDYYTSGACNSIHLPPHAHGSLRNNRLHSFMPSPGVSRCSDGHGVPQAEGAHLNPSCRIPGVPPQHDITMSCSEGALALASSLEGAQAPTRPSLLREGATQHEQSPMHTQLAPSNPLANSVL